MSARLNILGSLALLIVMASSVAAQQRQAPLGLDVSLPAAKRLAGAREFIAAQDWGAAIMALERLEEDFGGSLIEVEPGRYLNVRHAVAATLAGLPEPGRAAYRRRVDPALELLFREARDRHSPTLMRQVVRDGFASSFGDDALDWLAEQALETGDIGNARRWWTALLPPPAGMETQLLLRYPDPRLEPADVRARLALCSLLQGELERAQQEIAVFAMRHGDAHGQLADRTGTLAELLSALLAESRAWPAPADTAAFGSSTPRSADAAGLDLAAVHWSQPLVPAAATRAPFTAGHRFDLATVPVVWNDVLIVPETHAVRALNLADGTPRWPTGADDDDGTLYAEPPAATNSQDLRPPFGQSGCQIVGDRCYVRLAAPMPAVPSTPTAMPSARLVCLDLNAQGRLVWVAGSDEFAEFPDGRFSGRPLVSGDRVYVPVRWGSPQVEIGVACLDAGTGELRWQRQVCTALDAAPLTGQSGGQDTLGASGDSVYLLPSNGLLAACDAATGELQWAATYAAISSRTAPAATRDRRGDIVCHGGRVFVQPRDSNQLLAFSADDGRRLWSLDPPSRVHDLLGVVGSRLIASGDHLWGVDVATSRAWRFGFDDPEGHGYGRGAIAGGRIYWPTHDELYVVKTQTGQLVDRVLFNPASGISGGNLTVARDRLTIAGPSLLTTFGPTHYD